ncbi:MAG: aminotransferase class I/II-fold pyridoxal phosphate-dependent enzyme [Saprospiraceae bacterium]|nr:aminotransferase class I/II-fold pyridoxal phosphate-dependent enzyme [Saprospiraceae bacterium]
MLNPIPSKLPQAGLSIFAKMTALAQQYQAINLAQGFPDFAPPEQLFQFLNEAVESGFNQYAPMPGLLMLRQQIASRLENRYQLKANIDDDITVTAGATQAIYTIISAFIRPGDKVLIFEPAYDSYGPAVLVNGVSQFTSDSNYQIFSIPWTQLESMLQKGKIRMILINNPHNPAGRILHQEDMLRFEKLAVQYDVLWVWDEVYDMLVFDSKPHWSALHYPEIMKSSIVTFSMGKTLHNTGWKIGYTIAKAELTKEIRKVHQFLVFSVNTPAQYAIAKFMESYPEFINELPQFYQHKRDFFFKEMKHPDFEWLPCEGSYFALARFKNPEQLSDAVFAEQLVANKKVATIPISAFYHDGYDPGIVRFCFAKKEDTIKEAATQLLK